MNPLKTALIIVFPVALALGIGYWWGHQGSGVRDQASEPAASGQKPERKILYYRNPMGLPDTSPEPKKDSMGMDYIPVYEGDEPEGPQVKISLDKVQKLGVKTETTALRELIHMIRAVGTIQADERRLHTVTPKFEGWIQKLYVNTTGQSVRRGEALMEIYSPDLIATQEEYLIAWKGLRSAKNLAPEIQASMNQLMQSALQRLRNWDISEEELRRLQQEGAARQTLALRAPVAGVVMEKAAVEGMRIMPGEALYRIADLSSVWLLADVFEQDLGMIQPGQSARILINAYPEKVFNGKVTFIYPEIATATRTAKVRVELLNAEGFLKPSMYASVELVVPHSKAKVLTISDSAVLDSGARQIVLVQRGEGLYEPREVRLGMRADGYVEVIEGVREGEQVVVSANFLIDAESNLKAALGAFGGHTQHGSEPPAAEPKAAPEAQKHQGH